MNRLTSISFFKPGFAALPIVLLLLCSGKSLAQVPSITSISPTSAAVGATLTITGTNFGATPSDNVVFFGSVKAQVTAATATTVTVTVPAGALYSPISVLNTTSRTAGYSSQFFLPVFFPAKTTLAATDFTAQATVSGSAGSLSGLLTADLDNDGKPELIYTGQSSRHLYITPNTSSPGAITTGTTIDIDLTGLSAVALRFVAVGDVDNDGLPDIVVTNGSNGSSTVIVMRNTGTLNGFTAASAISFSADPNPNGITLADINGDGWLDVITTNASTNNINIFQNNSSGPGNISFLAKLPVSLGAAPTMVATADLNGDGKPEIFTVANNNTLNTWPNNSSGGVISLGTRITAGILSSEFDVAACDFDGDGSVDIAVTSASSSTLSIFRNTSSGGSVSLAARQDIAITGRSASISTGDLNGDGKPDVLLSDYLGYGTAPTYRISVLNNTSSGSISFASPIQLTADNIPFVNSIIDMDGDGKPDILSGHGTANTIAIYRNSSSIPPTITAVSPTSAAPGSAVTINGSFSTNASVHTVFFGGVKATPSASTGSSLTVTVPVGASFSQLTVVDRTAGLSAKSEQFFTPVFPGGKPTLISADITLQETRLITGSQIWGMAAGDLDGDNRPELILTTGVASDNKIYIRRNTSTASGISFAATDVSLTPPVGALSPTSGEMSVADLDADGRLDFVVPGNSSNSFVVFKNTGVLSNFSMTAVPMTHDAAATAIDDLDNDGRPDIVVSGYTNGSLSIFPNTSSSGAFSLGSAITYTGSFGMGQMVIFDVDGDGRKDIMAPHNTWHQIHFFRNTSSTGSISFAADQQLDVFGNTDHTSGVAAVGDLDQDGKNDLVLTDIDNATSTSIAILRNTSVVGTGSFSVTMVTLGAAPFPQSEASLADMNGDGKPDLLLNTQLTSPGRMLVLNNTSSSGNISFETPMELASTAALFFRYQHVVTDFNGDGYPDIIGNNLSHLSIFRGSPQTAPTITGFTPAGAAPGTSVVITGTGFHTSTTRNLVSFGTVTGTVTAAGSTSLTVTVPQNAAYGPIRVLNKSNTLSAASAGFFTPAFSPNKTTVSTTDFTQQGNISVTGDLYGMAAGDLTGDGKPELIVVNSSGNSLTLLPNTSIAGGVVTYGAATVLTGTGSLNDPRYTALADLDGNGWLDMAVPSFQLSTVVVFLNTGTGTLATTMTEAGSFGTGGSPNGIAVGDLDGDGRPDMVSSNFSGSSVSVLRNTSITTGAVRFDTKKDYQVSVSDAVYNLALADMDNDGKLDIIAGRDINSQFGKVVMLRNTSTIGVISFASAVEVNGPRGPWTIVPGDLNNDGLTDFVTSGAGTSGKQVFAYTKLSSGGAITNLSSTQLTMAETNVAIGLADLNGDGKADLVSGISNPSGGNYYTHIFPNTGTGTSTAFGTRIDLPASAMPWTTLVTDMNADGKPDIIMANRLSGNSTITVYRNTLLAPPVINAIAPVSAAAGTAVTISGRNFNTTATNNIVYFGQVRATVTGATATALTVTVPTSASFAPVSVVNTANGLMGTSAQMFSRTFAPSKTTLQAGDLISTGNVADGNAGGSLSGALAIDLNDDGKPELVTINAAGKTLYIRSNTGSPGTVNVNTVAGTYDLSAIGQPWLLSAGDMDRDGKPDLVVGFLNEHRVIVLRNGGDLANMTMSSQFATGTNPIDLALADINSDGMMDILTSNSNGHSVSVLQNTSTGAGNIGFNTKVDLALGASAIGLLVADMDGNGRPDVLVGRNASSVYSLSIFSNTGNAGDNITPATFAVRQDLPMAQGSKRMAAADMDGDGVLDIVLSNQVQSVVSIMRNNNTGGFSFTESSFSVSSLSHAIAVSDLNGDGKPDVVVSTTVNNSGYSIGMLANNSTSGNISLASAVKLTVSGPAPYENDIADMDGDGKPDIISGNSNMHNVTIFRNALLFAPTTQASNVNISSITTSSATIGWTNGNGQRRNVFMSEAASGEPAPADLTDYTASAQFGSGSQIGTTGWYCVFSNSSGNSVNVTGLNPSTGYRVMVVEYNNNGQNTAAVYNTATAVNNPVNFTTLATLNNISTTTVSSTVNTAKVDYAVNFGSAVSGLSTANFSLTAGGTISGALVTAVAGSGSTFTVTVNTGSGDGPLTLNLANGAGITPALTNTLPFAGQLYTIDKTAPDISPVTILSNNANSTLAKPGDIITVSFTAGEAIPVPVVAIAGATATVTNTGGNNWHASRTMTNSEANGAVAFSIQFADIIGNTGAVTATTNGSSVVFDRTLPVLAPVTIASSNADPAKAITGNVVTLKFTAGETIVPTATIATHTVTPTYTGGNSWSAACTLTADDNEGVIPFSIAFNDLSGNAGTAVTATTNSSSVVFDKTLPTLSLISISSANADITKAKIGDAITLAFTSSEPILPPLVSIASHTITATDGGSNQWTAVYTVTGADDEGVVPFNIAFSDLAGNAGISVTTTTNSSSVTLDKTLPALTVTTISSSNANSAKAKTGDVITLAFTSLEPIGSPVVKIGGHTVAAADGGSNQWTATYTMTDADVEGVVPFDIAFADLVGNTGTTVTATTNSSSVMFDKTLPVLTTVSISSSNTDITKAKPGDLVTLNFTASETIAMPQVTIAGHTVTPVSDGGNNWIASHTLNAGDTPGTVAFSIAFADETGNNGLPVTATTNSSSVVFDSNTPVLTAVSLRSSNTDPSRAKVGDMVVLSFLSSKIIGTPVVLMGGHVVTANNTTGNNWSAAYTMTAGDVEGFVSFSIAFADQSGNTGATVTTTTDASSVQFDKTLPALITATIVSSNNDAARAKAGDMIALHFTSSESIQQPIVSIAGHTVTATNTGANNWSATYTMAAADTEGAVSFNISFADLYGNTGAPVSATTNGGAVVFDKTNPWLTAVTIGSNNANPAMAVAGNTVTLSFTAGETISVPVVSIATHAVVPVNTGGNSWKASYTLTAGDAPGNVAFSVSSYSDNAGNAGATVTVTSDNSHVNLVVSGSNTVPVFNNGASQTLLICENASAQSLGSLLRVTDPDAVQNLTWTAISAPAHGSLSGFPATAVSNTGTIIPMNLSYTPAPGYSGQDAFTIQVSDGVAVATMVISVTMEKPVAATRMNLINTPGSSSTPLQARSFGAAYLWAPSTGLSNPNVSNPTTSLHADQEYRIAITTTAGCVTVDTLLVRVYEERVYVANVFSPNGDGKNDILLPNLIGVKELRYFRVFNRFGKKLFETANMGQGWDGRYNGSYQPVDSYVWTLEAITKEGILIVKQGTITLLR